MVNGSLKPQGEHPTANCLWREATEDLNVTTQCDTLKIERKRKEQINSCVQSYLLKLILRIKDKVSGNEGAPLRGGKAQKRQMGRHPAVGPHK